MTFKKLKIIIFLILISINCVSQRYSTIGKRNYSKATHSTKKKKWVQIGYATWYGPGFHGKKTASGEIFNMYDLTAAHRTLPFGTIVKVTNLRNGKSVIVRINDRGPFANQAIIDLSYKAAKMIDLKGKEKVKIEVIKWGKK